LRDARSALKQAQDEEWAVDDRRRIARERIAALRKEITESIALIENE